MLLLLALVRLLFPPRSVKGSGVPSVELQETLAGVWASSLADVILKEGKII